VPGSVGPSVGGFASTLEEQRVLKEGPYRYGHLLRYFVGVGKAAAAVCLSLFAGRLSTGYLQVLQYCYSNRPVAQACRSRFTT